MKPSDITKLGIGVSPEGREVFGGLSVEDNLRIGAYTRKDKKKLLICIRKYMNCSPSCRTEKAVGGNTFRR